MLRNTILLFICCSLLVALPAPILATEAEDAAEIAAGLRSFAGVLDGLGDFEAFAESLPLLSIAPGAPEVLNLGEIFGLSLGNLPAGLPSLGDLEAAIDGADITLPGGAEIRFENVQVMPAGGFVDPHLRYRSGPPGPDSPLGCATALGSRRCGGGGGGPAGDLEFQPPGSELPPRLRHRSIGGALLFEL